MQYDILQIGPIEPARTPISGPTDEATINLIADLADREKLIGQPFTLEKLDPEKHHVAVCVGKSVADGVFCIPSPTGRGPAVYVWTPLDQIVTMNGFLLWAGGHLPIANLAEPIVPPLKVGTQYWLKASKHSDKALAEEMRDVDTLSKAYLARFAGIVRPKPLPTEAETPTLKPLGAAPKSKKAVDAGLVPEPSP